MHQRLQELHSTLDRDKREMVSRLEGMTEPQRQFRPREDSWSPLEVAHHVFLAEEFSVSVMLKQGDRRSGRRSLKDRLGYAGVWLVLKAGIKVKNPVPAAAPSPDVTLAEITEAWSTVRTQLVEYLEPLQENDLRRAAIKHPIAGPMDIEAALVFLTRHLQHHLRQIGRREDDPAFPSAA